MARVEVIDSHIHCGTQHVNQAFEIIQPLLQEAGISGACLFAPVEDVYDRFDPDFEDDAHWQGIRHAANRYVLELAARHASIFPYLFVWNDFAVEELGEGYRGIKWHRHPNEPVYDYDDPRCGRMIREVSRRRLPVVLEESFENTCRFVEELAPDAVIIIPHLGALNGSYRALERAGVWRRGNTYADTALAGTDEMRRFLRQYGPDRLLFGSDSPFGLPADELRRVESLGLSSGDFEKVVGGNLRTLMAAIVP